MATGIRGLRDGYFKQTTNCHHKWDVDVVKKEVNCIRCGLGFIFRNRFIENFYKALGF